MSVYCVEIGINFKIDMLRMLKIVYVLLFGFESLMRNVKNCFTVWLV